MSNLYKQWFVRTEETNTRVIDSNAVIGNLMEKNTVKKPRTVGTEGFAEGLFAENIENAVPLELSGEEALQAAKDEAEAIVEQAGKQADELLEQANSEVENIRQQAKDRGIADGQQWIEQEISKKNSELEEQYQDRKQKLESDYLSKREEMETELVDVILKVFNKVFHIQFDNKKEILMYLINNAILNIEGEKSFRIKAAAENVQFLEEHKDEILDRIGHDIDLEIVTDSMMDGNECMIETDSGVFDCSLGVQLENLVKDIRSLCS